MVLEDKMLASADDMTAAEIAPNPKKDTHWIESWEYTITCAILKNNLAPCFLLVVYSYKFTDNLRDAVLFVVSRR
jgi:hypothetical protein